SNHARWKRRIVHEDHRGPLPRIGQTRLHPAEPTRAEPTSVLAGHQRVEGDETQRPFLDGVLDEAAVAGKVSVMVEYSSQVLAVVVVARDEVRWHRQRLKHRTKALVLLHAAMLTEVAGCDHRVWTRPKRVQVRDCALKVGGRAKEAVVAAARRAQVHV